MTRKDIEIMHQDEDFIVINKPGGLLAVPGRGPDKQDSVVTRVKSIVENCIEQPAVHRLDMYTSGLMVLALTQSCHRFLSIQFEQRRVNKKYIALLDGVPEQASGTIKLRFRLDVENRPYQIYDPIKGKEGISHWKKLGVEDQKTRIEFTPVTGRTHQLRLHASHPKGLNTPIVGDKLYGTGKEGDQMCLHASYLQFYHPKTGKEISFRSEVPF